MAKSVKFMSENKCLTSLIIFDKSKKYAKISDPSNQNPQSKHNFPKGAVSFVNMMFVCENFIVKPNKDLEKIHLNNMDGYSKSSRQNQESNVFA